jgi:hypothetical protein
MHLIGDKNWYLPDWLGKVTPQVSFEPADDLEAEGDRVLVGNG